MELKKQETSDFENAIIKATHIVEEANLPERHSYYQIEKFIIGKEPTTQAQLWQIVRELQARLESFDSLKDQLEECEDNLELFDIRMQKIDKKIRDESQKNSEESFLNIKELEIEIRKETRKKKALIRTAKKLRKKMQHLLEELMFFVQAYEKIIATCKEMKPYDDLEAQQEMWNEKLLEEYNLRAIFNKPLDTEFIRTILCLHDEAPIKQHIIKLINNIQDKLLKHQQKHLEKKQVQDMLSQEQKKKKQINQ